MGQENTHSCVIKWIVPASVVTLAGEEACGCAARSCHKAAAADDVKVAAAVVTSGVSRWVLACMEVLTDAGVLCCSK